MKCLSCICSIGGVGLSTKGSQGGNKPPEYGNVKLKAGKYKLTGEQALAYCRIRKIDTDFMRAKRQNGYSSIIKSAKSANPATLYKMAYNSAPYIETSFTKSS
ncbi:MAG: LCP family protein [Eubacterium sp.]